MRHLVQRLGALPLLVPLIERLKLCSSTATATWVNILVLAFQDGSRLHHLTSLAPPQAVILEVLGFPPAERYVTGDH